MKSNINEVQLLANKYNVGKVYHSSRKDRKYMIIHNNKKVHFGDPNYEDFTYHHDLKRREQFRQRNARWKNVEKFTPAWLSYHLLW